MLFMASEQAFWRNFCAAVDRLDMFERWPGSKYADHARNNTEMRRELRDIFGTRTAEEWIAFGIDEDVPIAPVNSPKTIAADPQFRDRFHWIGRKRLGADQLATPLKFVGEELPLPEHAPTVGQHSDEVVRDVLGWDHARIAASPRAVGSAVRPAAPEARAARAKAPAAPTERSATASRARRPRPSPPG